jgi:hypothetical protein
MHSVGWSGGAYSFGVSWDVGWFELFGAMRDLAYSGTALKTIWLELFL